MAFNLSTFKTRTLTSIVFVAIMLAGLLINKWTFFALFSIIHFGCWIEYQQLTGKINPAYEKISPVHKYGVMLLGWWGMIFAFLFLRRFLTDQTIYIIHTIQWIGLVLLIVLVIHEFIYGGKEHFWTRIKYSLGGLLYISFSFTLIISLHSLDKWSPLLLIATLWINDTMAYMVGSFIGKTPLSKISPKKTWEGTIGGIILAVIVMTIISYLLFPNYSKYLLFLHSIGFIVIAIAGTFGDLLESKIKRLAGVKDSGTLMPGHGGFLDRFDSLLLATPAVLIYFVFLAVLGFLIEHC